MISEERRLKIAMLSSDYFPGIGGIASHIYQLSLNLQKMGHEVEIWYWDRARENPDPATMGDIPVRIIGGGRSVRQLSRAILQQYRSFPASVMHIHTLDALLQTVSSLKKSTDASFVWTNHTSRFLRKSESWLWRMKMRHRASGIDGLLTASQDRMDASQFLDIPHRLNVPNGVDLAQFPGGDRRLAREQLGIPEDQFVPLYTGRFAPVKGVVYLAEALVRMGRDRDDFTAVFCGDIPGDRESAKVRELLEQGGLSGRFRFEGFIPNSEVGVYLTACDVLVLPSLMEATSISCLEAMASARAVIGTRIGGIEELIEEGETGFLVPARDSGELCHALLHAAGRADLDRMGENGRQRVVEAYTWSHTSEKIAHFYHELCES